MKTLILAGYETTSSKHSSNKNYSVALLISSTVSLTVRAYLATFYSGISYLSSGLS